MVVNGMGAERWRWIFLTIFTPITYYSPQHYVDENKCSNRNVFSFFTVGGLKRPERAVGGLP